MAARDTGTSCSGNVKLSATIASVQGCASSASSKGTPHTRDSVRDSWHRLQDHAALHDGRQRAAALRACTFPKPLQASCCYAAVCLDHQLLCIRHHTILRLNLEYSRMHAIWKSVAPAPGRTQRSTLCEGPLSTMTPSVREGTCAASSRGEPHKGKLRA